MKTIIIDSLTEARNLDIFTEPSYNELVRALAFTLQLVDDGPEFGDEGRSSSQEAQLQSARKLLLRAQAAQ